MKHINQWILALHVLCLVSCSIKQKNVQILLSHDESTQSSRLTDFISLNNQQLKRVNVRYKDFSGQIQTDGVIEIPDSLVDRIKSSFDELLDSNFRIKNVSPLSQFESVHQALSVNATFAFTDEMGHTNLIINPAQNPIILRESTNTKKPSNQLYIFPARSILAINQNESPLVGKMQDFAIRILEKNQFSQIFQPQGDSSWLFFGFFQYNTSKKAIPQSTPVSKKRAPLSKPSFSYRPLPDSVKQQLTKDSIWKKGCPVGLDRLSYVSFVHYGFDGQLYNDNIVSADVVAPEVVEIMQHLYKEQAPVEGTESSGIGGTGMFNCRAITGSAGFSLHSYGTALDLSYYHNPYVGVYTLDEGKLFAKGIIVPSTAPLIHLARNLKIEGFNEKFCSFITGIGLSEWGGSWLNRTDYMHFQTSPFFSYLFPLLSYEDGRKLFTLHKTKDNLLRQFSLEDTEIAKWQLLSKLYSRGFADAFVENIDRFSALGENGFYEFLLEYLETHSPTPNQ